MTRHAVTCQNVCKLYSLHVNNNNSLEGEILLHITGYPVDMTIKLGQSTNLITNMFSTELHVCKQQQTPTFN